MPHSTFQESLLQGLHELSRLDSWIRLLGMAPSAGIMGPDLKMASLGPMGRAAVLDHQERLPKTCSSQWPTDRSASMSASWHGNKSGS